jgi:hypothetical protein
VRWAHPGSIRRYAALSDFRRCTIFAHLFGISIAGGNSAAQDDYGQVRGP